VPTPWYFYRKHGGSISHRLSLAAVEAIQAADARLGAAIVRERPELAGACAVRARAYARAAAFEGVIAALRARDAPRAARLMLRHPAMLPMLRMPCAGLARKLLRPLRPGPAAAILDDEQHRRLREAADAAITRAAVSAPPVG
jgi:succinoglycan biosynthesis protein ExoO